MFSLLLAAALTASPPIHAASGARDTAQCTADRLKRFVSPLGTNQVWPKAQELPVQLHGQMGTVLSEQGQVLDGYRHVLHVEPAKNTAYVVQVGGFAGTMTVFGPLPVAACPPVAL